MQTGMGVGLLSYLMQSSLNEEFFCQIIRVLKDVFNGYML